MDDLISRSAVFEAIQSSGLLDTISQPEAILLEKTIKNIKAAYNVDKVVEQVKEITDRINNYCEEIDHNIPEDERSGYKMLPDLFKLREIVKAGGVNESQRNNSIPQ